MSHWLIRSVKPLRESDKLGTQRSLVRPQWLWSWSLTYCLLQALYWGPLPPDYLIWGDMCWFPVAAVRNYHKCSDFSNMSSQSYSSGGQKSETGLTGVKAS